jgi:starch-binding outer membrane protein, SusD/RagB family
MKKKIFYLLISIIYTIGVTSCKKSLNVTPDDFISFEDAYNTKPQIEAALNGVYYTLAHAGLYGSNLFYETAIGNDEAYFRADKSTSTLGVRVHNVNSADADVASLWRNCYIGIDRANSILGAMPKSPADTAVKNSAIAQAKFLRGYLYFLLVDNFGKVPLRLKAVTSYEDAAFAPSLVKDIYSQVIKDITEAEAMLPSITVLGPTGSGRPSKSAAQGILAKIYLTMAGQPLNDVAKYQDAKDWALKVINSNLHVLNPDYKQIFINHTQDKYDIKECIWEIELTLDPTNANRTNVGRNAYVNGIKCDDIDTGFCSGQVGAMKKLWDTYTDLNDKRKNWNIAPYVFNTTGTVTTRSFYAATQIWDRWPGKWRREYETAGPKIKFFNGVNFPVIRYADILLMFAEAENEINNGPTPAAFNAVNLVRARAGAALFTAIDYPGKTDFKNMIMEERMRELCFEGVRSHDLIRWGVFVPTMKALANDIQLNGSSSFKFAALAGNNITDRDVLLPIPLAELTSNKLMVQNPGF